MRSIACVLFATISGPCFSFLQAQLVTEIVLTHKTATKAHAATNAGFSIILNRPGPDCDVHIPSKPNYNERVKGQTDTYSIDVRDCNIQLNTLTPSEIGMKIGGEDAWLPSSIKFVAKTQNGTRHTIVDRSWPNTLWFSSDATEFVDPWKTQAEWMMDASGVDKPGEPILIVAPSSVKVVFRHKFHVTGAPRSCDVHVTLTGRLQSAAPGGVSGATSKTATKTNTGVPQSVGGDYYVCDVAEQWTSLKAGAWRFEYQVTNGSSGSCNKNVPLPASATGDINFTNGVTSCRTDATFP